MIGQWQELEISLRGMSGFFNVPASTLIECFEWTSELWNYPDRSIGGDTYPVTWAADDQLYASSGDPNYGESDDGLDFLKLDGIPPQVQLTQINPMKDWEGFGGWGPKPTGLIEVDGSLYLAVQNFYGWRPPVRGRASQHGSDALILRSDDGGKSWTPPRAEITQPYFPGPRFGGPAFINHGKGNELARDSFVYAVSSDHWDNGSEIRLGRAPKEQVADAKAWQWVEAWEEDGSPKWSPWLNDAIPVLASPRTLSCPDMVWMPALNRYLLVTWYFHKDFDPGRGTDLIVYDAPNPWGPFTLAHYEREWLGAHVGPYCPKIPLKWLDADGLGGWMLTSGNFIERYDPERPFYRPNAKRFRIKLRDPKSPIAEPFI